MKGFSRLLAVIAGSIAILTTSLSAGENKIPEPFRGSDVNSPFYINYKDLSAVLKLTVLETEKSERRALRRPPTSMGTRIQRGNPNSTRHEGNRVLFHAFSKTDANREILTNIRRDLEAVPDEVPMKHWKKREQLAYWLNIHNITMIELVLDHYPIRSIKKLTTGPKSILDKKVLRVAGIELSLNDIQHTIIAEKWGGTLPIYGLFQGYVGGPNMRNQAYTGSNVYRMLEENAQEFVNSNRGMSVNGRTLKISELYKINRAKFPNWDQNVKKHVMSLAEVSMRDQINATKVIKATTKDYYIADLFGGSRNTGTSVNTNVAALDAMIVTAQNNFMNSPIQSGSNPFIEPHILATLDKVRMRRYVKDGTVALEELEQKKEKASEKEKDDNGNKH